MWDVIITLLKEAITGLVNLSDKKKKSAARLCQEISVLVETVAKELEQDMYPHNSCSTMRALSQNLLYEIEWALSKDKAIELSDLLISASALEREYANRKDPQTCIKLLEVAGEFRAFSILLSA